MCLVWLHIGQWAGDTAMMNKTDKILAWFESIACLEEADHNIGKCEVMINAMKIMYTEYLAAWFEGIKYWINIHSFRVIFRDASWWEGSTHQEIKTVLISLSPGLQVLKQWLPWSQGDAVSCPERGNRAHYFSPLCSHVLSVTQKVKVKAILFCP